MLSISFQQIKESYKRIRSYIHHTPVMSSSQLDSETGCSLFFKCENLQRTGAFKIRGAMNAVLQLNDKERKCGVTTHSSGNHAAALAFAAKTFDIPAYMVMPDNAPIVKQQAVKGYGAEIIPCKPTMDDRERMLNHVVCETSAAVIPSYNDHRIISGQGTAALEFLEEYPDLDMLLAPVGGGGLISGTAIVGKSVNPNLRVIGVEPLLADDAKRSLKAGKIIPSTYPNTIADGLRTSLGDITFPIIQNYVDEITTVTEQEIIDAMFLIWERMKIIIEPSSAVPVAALLFHDIKQAGKNVGVILSGGNVDLKSLPWMKA